MRKYIRVKPRWWKYIPLLSGNTANTIYPYIYLPQEKYNDIASGAPRPESIATLIHEEVHREREKECGLLMFGFKYFFSRKFRLNEELLAIAPQMKYLKSNSVSFDIKKRATLLSGQSYLWAGAYKDIEKKLKEMWDSL